MFDFECKGAAGLIMSGFESSRATSLILKITKQQV